MSVGLDAVLSSVSRGRMRPRRCSSLGQALGSPLEEARRSILADATLGEWHFFGSEAGGGLQACVGGTHRR